MLDVCHFLPSSPDDREKRFRQRLTTRESVDCFRGKSPASLASLSLSLALLLWLHPSAFSLPIILICLPCRLLSAAAAALCALTRTQEEGINQKRGKRKEGSKKVVSSRGTRVLSLLHRELALASRGRRQATSEREAKVVHRWKGKQGDHIRSTRTLQGLLRSSRHRKAINAAVASPSLGETPCAPSLSPLLPSHSGDKLSYCLAREERQQENMKGEREAVVCPSLEIRHPDSQSRRLPS